MQADVILDDCSELQVSGQPVRLWGRDQDGNVRMVITAFEEGKIHFQDGQSFLLRSRLES